MFLNFFYKTEAGHVLTMFLTFWRISASRSCKLGSYKKKNKYSVSFSILLAERGYLRWSTIFLLNQYEHDQSNRPHIPF